VSYRANLRFAMFSPVEAVVEGAWTRDRQGGKPILIVIKAGN
jgi:hypothetical protein